MVNGTVSLIFLSDLLLLVYKNATVLQKLYDADERNQRWHKQMERYTMFLDLKNQYCQNDYTTQGDLQIQCNPYQITNGIFHRTRTKNLKICMETQKTLNSQSNPEKEKRSWRNQAPWLQTPWLQTILQRYSHQNSMVLAQKQNYRSMEQDRKLRNKPTHLWSINPRQRRQNYTMGERQSLQ